MEIYTDGSCEPNPGVGGWAYVVVKNDEVLTSGFGYEEKTTNNRMEFTAAIEALKEWGDEVRVIYSDSQLLVSTANEWIWNWEKKGWKRPHKNRDLVFELHRLLLKRHVEFTWVRGHSGNNWNELADELASRAMLKAYEASAGLTNIDYLV